MTGKPVLQVTMLGGFELRYDLEPVQLKKRQRSKPVQLMQLLLHSRETGVSRQRLIEALYGQETGIDTANNLNATVSQLRRLLQNTILPKENYILTDIDRYRFNCSFPVHVDTEEVLALRQEAMVKEGQERMDLLSKLCACYQGRFLPELDGESWVETARGYYQRIYRESMDLLCRMLWEAREYQEILRLMDCAVKLFPFDEWQTWQYESLLAQGRIREAQELYREVEKLYLSELGTSPPERMRRWIRSSGREPWRETQNLQMIRDQMNVSDWDGPFCLPLPSFLDAYRLVCRMSRAAGQPVCLMLCTLRGTENSFRPDRTLLRTATEQLEAALYQTLRQEDAFTRYSRNQFLLLLVGVEETDCGTISCRVSLRFRSIGGNQRLALDCQAVSSGYMQASSQ